jgi:H+/gluconate symporter-like permease
MIIGMVPMALGLGEGGEQNAPLGRAVIGGLIVATVATLFFVPVVYSIVNGGKKQKPSAGSDPGRKKNQPRDQQPQGAHGQPAHA